MKCFVATVCTAVVVLFAQPAISLLDADCPSIETKKETFKGKGKARYWYRTDPAADPCKLLLFLGVGTAMSVDDYHKIAHSVLAHNTDMTVIFGDANPGWPAKYDAEKYRGLVNHVYESVANIVECNKTKVSDGRKPLVLIGGHSASGRAAFLSAATTESLSFKPIGFVGLDPWWICSDDLNTTGFLTNNLCRGRGPFPIAKNLPSLSFGFENQTCLVDPPIAALGAYKSTNPCRRVLYELRNPPTTTGQRINHCTFTDTGCPSIGPWGWGCPIKAGRYEYIYDLVGQAVQKFVTAIFKPALFAQSARHFDLHLPPHNATLLVADKHCSYP